jgi:hypothetical protein
VLWVRYHGISSGSLPRQMERCSPQLSRFTKLNIAANGAIANSSSIRPYKTSLRNTFSRSDRIKYVSSNGIQVAFWQPCDGMKLDSRDCGAASFAAELRVEALDISQLRARIGNFEQTKTRLVSVMRRIPVQQPPRIPDGRTSRTIWRNSGGDLIEFVPDPTERTRGTTCG